MLEKTVDLTKGLDKSDEENDNDDFAGSSPLRITKS